MTRDHSIRDRRRNRGESDRFGVSVGILLVLTFTLLFWLLVLWVLPGRSLIEISRLWGTPEYGGFSLFSASAFVVLLLLYLLIVEAILARRARDNLAVAFCLLSALPLAAVGSLLVDLAHLPSYFLLETFERLDEPFDARNEYLGRVLKTQDGTTQYLQVVLEDGTKVMVAAVPRYLGPPRADHVVVRQFTGRYTHTLCHQLSSYLPPGWLDMMTVRRLDALK